MSGQADVLIAESHLHTVWKGEEERGREKKREEEEVSWRNSKCSATWPMGSMSDLMSSLAH